MKARLITTAFLLLTSFAQFSCSDQKLECQKIAQRTEELIRAGDLDQLYASLAHGAKSSTSRTEFDERANRLISELKRADSTLSFAEVRQGGVNPDGPIDLYKEFRTVGNGENTIDVEISIDLELPIRLFDVCAKPTGRMDASVTCLTDALRKI